VSACSWANAFLYLVYSGSVIYEGGNCSGGGGVFPSYIHGLFDIETELQITFIKEEYNRKIYIQNKKKYLFPNLQIVL